MAIWSHFSAAICWPNGGGRQWLRQKQTIWTCNFGAKWMNDPAVIEEILRTMRTIAVVGMSDKTWRASHHIGTYLASNGYHVLPVNPALKEVIGLACYPDLESAQAAAREQTSAGID